MALYDDVIDGPLHPQTQRLSTDHTRGCLWCQGFRYFRPNTSEQSSSQTHPSQNALMLRYDLRRPQYLNIIQIQKRPFFFIRPPTPSRLVSETPLFCVYRISWFRPHIIRTCVPGNPTACRPLVVPGGGGRTRGAWDGGIEQCESTVWA